MMRHFTRGLPCLLLVVGMAGYSSAPVTVPAIAPPAAVAATRLVSPAAAPRNLGLAASTQLYSIGDPTDEEQLYLEYINRSRANPLAEATRLVGVTDPVVRDNYDFFQVDLNLLVAQYALLPPTPPLSFNAILVSVARLHSQDMLENNFQDHYGFKGCPANSPVCDPAIAPAGITNLGCCLPFDRMTAAGYVWSRAAENVFAFAKSAEHGHDSFEVDWGGTAATGGMQDPPGHRDNIHNPDYREIGIGVVIGTNTKVGPQLVTQNFGTSFEATPLVTGVAYYDLNGNGFYDSGEGIGGVKVTIPGANYYAVTANSGGYSVPVPADGNYTVTFSLPGAGDISKAVLVSQSQNVKVDLVPPYPPPALTGGNAAYLNNNNFYNFTPVGGATAYQWQQTTRVSWTMPEGAETGAGTVTTFTTPGYAIITSDTKAAGQFSFHLTQLPNFPDDQVIVLNRNLRLGTNSDLVFYSRLSAATTNQIARAQISADGGRSWQTVWSQVGEGKGHIGEVAFTKKNISLAAFAGKVIQARFLYATDGAYFVGAQLGTGFYVDEIIVTSSEDLTSPVITDAGNTTNFVFTPKVAGNYALRVRAQVSGRWLDFGPPLLVTGSVGVPVTSLKVADLQFLLTGQIQLQFDLLAGNFGNFHLESAPTPIGPWAADPTATIQPTSSSTRLRILGSRVIASQRYYRVTVN
ncbi:MAG: carboxypeptidase regulatory-like domain-containing protein [Verrucomicrobia bacterium]|nr:carboxypeptidase regulatory-like domain-containing protein [Verrucomicrobiota bacterium]